MSDPRGPRDRCPVTACAATWSRGQKIVLYFPAPMADNARVVDGSGTAGSPKRHAQVRPGAPDNRTRERQRPADHEHGPRGKRRRADTVQDSGSRQTPERTHVVRRSYPARRRSAPERKHQQAGGLTSRDTTEADERNARLHPGRARHRGEHGGLREPEMAQRASCWCKGPRRSRPPRTVRMAGPARDAQPSDATPRARGQRIE